MREQQDLRSTIIAAVLLVVAAYIKPMALGLIVCIVLYQYFFAKECVPRSNVVFIVTVVALILPWSLRNFIVFDALVPVSTNGGLNFYIGEQSECNGEV